MGQIFKNQNESRLKAGWRILLFIILFWCLSTVSLIIKPLFGDLTKREYLSNYSLVIVAILAVAATISVKVIRKYIDKKSFKTLGLHLTKKSVLDVIFGFILSGIMVGAFLLLNLLSGTVELVDINFAALSNFQAPTSYVNLISTVSILSMSLLLLEHILVGFWEELVFRGYLFQNMREGIGSVGAIIISCILYGIIHAANPNATVLSSCIIVLFGYLRIYGYLVTKMLWLSIGMHIGWNFFQGPVFGFAASGHQNVTFLELDIKEPSWMSGGDFGPEGSIMVLPVLLGAVIIMNIWGKRRSKMFNY